MIRRRSSVLAAATLAVVGLTACNPAPGEATVTVDSAVLTGETSGGTATCDDRGVGGETYIPTWRWEGSIDGHAVALMFGSQDAHLPNSGTVTIDGQQWVVFHPFSAGTVDTLQVDEDGTLHVEATFLNDAGHAPTDPVVVEAAVRCPGWGHAELTGVHTGATAGVTTCPAPGEQTDAYVTYEIWDSALEGYDVGGKLTFAGLTGPTVDTVTFEKDGVTWAAMNRPDRPPTVDPEVDDEGVLHVTASLTRLDLRPGELTVDATVRCP